MAVPTRDYTAGAYKLLFGHVPGEGEEAEAGQDLGWSEEAPRVTFFSGGEWQVVTVDQFGSMPLDAIFRSVERIQVTFAAVQWHADILDVALRSVFDKGLSSSGQVPLIPRYPAGSFAIKNKLWRPLLVTPYVEAGSRAAWEFYFYHTHPTGICDITLSASRMKKLPMEFLCLPKLEDISESGEAPDGWPDDTTLIPNFGYIKNLAYEAPEA